MLRKIDQFGARFSSCIAENVLFLFLALHDKHMLYNASLISRGAIGASHSLLNKKYHIYIKLSTS